MSDALASIAEQLARPSAARGGRLSIRLRALHDAAPVLRAAGMVDLAEAFERKVRDPRLSLDDELGVKLRPGQRLGSAGTPAQEAALRSAVELTKDRPGSGRMKAAALLSWKKQGDAAAVAVYRELEARGLPTTEKNLGSRLESLLRVAGSDGA